MNLLVIGNGGREHAIAWKLSQSSRSGRVYVAPGNAGTALDKNMVNVPIDSTDIPALLKFAQGQKIHFTLVGPEAPLALGIVDQFRAQRLKIFGPTQAAAQLESSKSYAKDFMARHHIPTAHYATFTDLDAAQQYIKKQGAPIVVKADGLASGKGVIVATTEAEALQAVTEILTDNKFGHAGSSVVIEEFLEGEEASFILICDGEYAIPLASSQDHKRLLDHDQGPNTGGMGAYSPAPVVTPTLHAKVMQDIVRPTLQGMAEEGAQYSGFLYVGLMIDKAGNPKVLEFNCRLGDPETQPILMRLKSDFLTLMEHAIQGKLEQVEKQVQWDHRCALTVVLAAAGYPEQSQLGDVIRSIPPSNDHVRIFHAGTKMQDKNIVVQGGRVLSVTALGSTLKQAQHDAYQLARQVQFTGCQMRHDIGFRAIR